MTGMMMEGYRVLDLTNELGFLCGRILATLGMDVLKVEPPGGDPSRLRNPFVADVPDGKRSLYWRALNCNKRGITLDLQSPRGRELFERLIGDADFLVESFAPGYLESLGLGYETLARINPRIIVTSITPFGQTGPYRDFIASDLTIFALSGILSTIGDPDRPPVRPSPLDLSYYIGSMAATTASLAAHYYRANSGEGQSVDVAIFDCAVRAHFRDPAFWELAGRLPKRAGPMHAGRIATQQIWPCRDGFVAFALYGAPTGTRDNLALARWMEAEGFHELKDVKWEELDFSSVTQEYIDWLSERIARFFRSHTKAELWSASVAADMLLAPLAEVGEVLANEDLRARGFWVEQLDPELDAPLAYPGHFYRTTLGQGSVYRPAPSIGEHNDEVYGSELKLSGAEIEKLRAEGVI